MKLNRISRPAAAVAVAVALLVTVSSAGAHGDKEIKFSFAMPIKLAGNFQLDSTNNPGPQVSISGAMQLGGLDVRAIFRNNEKGTHEHVEDVTMNGVVIPADHAVTIPKQPVEGGTGGNPFVWFQLLDGKGKALTGETFLGRIVQGLEFKADAILAVAAAADIAIDCSNNPGPFITVDGLLSLGGLTAKFIFRNNDNPVDGPHNASVTRNVTLIGAGTTIKFPKQPVLGGVGGNPWIFVQFSTGGEAITDEIALGRCVQGLK